MRVELNVVKKLSWATSGAIDYKPVFCFVFENASPLNELLLSVDD